MDSSDSRRSTGPFGLNSLGLRPINLVNCPAYFNDQDRTYMFWVRPDLRGINTLDVIFLRIMLIAFHFVLYILHLMC